MNTSEIQQHLNQLAKPPGSLGQLERLAERLCLIQQTLAPVTQPRRLVVFAGDHGVAAAGVTAWPSTVTAAMIATLVAGDAVSSVLARQSSTDLRVVDVGSCDPVLHQAPHYRDARLRQGSRDLSREAALTLDEFHHAWQVGATEAQAAEQAGMRVVAAGEMGIGNTTPAAALTALLTGRTAEQVVGRGAGADDAMLHHKTQLVAQAVARVQADSTFEPTARIAALAGFEIIAMAGFFQEAAQRQLTIILDGFIATAAALVAEHLFPGVVNSMLAAHRSAEPGHAVQLAHLQLEPWLAGWNMRLGEGTGALLLMPLLDAAAALVQHTAPLATVLGRVPAAR